MSEIAGAKIPLDEMDEKLEYLINSYQQYMKLYKIKYKEGILEAVILTCADLIENRIKLNLSKVTKSLFSIKHKNVDLIIEKMTAPGNEVAYIVNARETFRKK